MRIYGITGTNGKTTTAWILREFLGVPVAFASCGYAQQYLIRNSASAQVRSRSCRHSTYSSG